MQVNCRVPDGLGERIDEAADEQMNFRSEVVRRAIKWYIAENPDDITAFSRTGRTSRAGHEEAEVDVESGIYDPAEEG